MTRILHKSFLVAALAAVSCATMLTAPAGAQMIILGQQPLPPGPPVVAYPQSPAPAPLLTAEQIDQLTGPIALYPDPLLAQLLPAATYPDDIAAAAGWIAQNPQPTEDGINAQPWDPSVKTIAHYPTVLQQMSSNMEWTQALGSAFINQPQDVMDSIQRLRGQAQAVGNLYTTPEQQVVADNNYIEILPAQPDFVFVPVYDVQFIFFERNHHPRFHDRFHLRGDFGFDWRNHWVSRGFDWDHFRPGHAVEHRGGDMTARPWTRDNHRPLPVMPPKYVRPAAKQDFRGYQPAPAYNPRAFDANQNRADIERAENRARQSNRPNQNVPAPQPSAPRVEPRATPAPAPHAPPPPRVEPRAAPAPRPAAPAPRAAPAPPPPAPRPAPAPAPRPAPAPPSAPAFHPSGGSNVGAQSDRGHGSMHR
jgi:hypothetical protein